MERIIWKDVERECEDGGSQSSDEDDVSNSPRASRGFRLGGKARNMKLAALARAASGHSRSLLGIKAKKEYQSARGVEPNDKVESKVNHDNGDKDESFDLRADEQVAILFHLYSPCKSLVPRIDLDIIARALGNKGFAEWTAPATNTRHRIVCMRYRKAHDAEHIWTHFADRRNGGRKVFHLGQGLEARAVSKQTVTKHEVGFKNDAKNHCAAPRSRNEAAVTNKAEVLDDIRKTLQELAFPDLLDELGDQIISIQRAFDMYMENDALLGYDRVFLALQEGLHLNSTRAETALKTVSLEEFSVRGGNISQIYKTKSILDLASFCRLCAFLLRHDEFPFVHQKSAADQFRPKRLHFDEAEAKVVFDNCKLFPGDNFIESYEVGPALRALGLPANDDQVLRSLDDQGIDRIRYNFFLSMAHDFLAQ